MELMRCCIESGPLGGLSIVHCPLYGYVVLPVSDLIATLRVINYFDGHQVLAYVARMISTTAYSHDQEPAQL